ncbi:MAG: histidine kinase [Bacteroidota bacterium]
MKYRIKKIASSILFQHILFWIAVVSLLIYPDLSTTESDFWSKMVEDLISIAFIFLSVYLNLWLLIPKLLRKRKYFLYIIALLFGVLLLSCLDLYIALDVFDKDYSSSFQENTTQLFQRVILILSSFMMILFFVVLTTFIKLFRDWIKLQDNIIKMKEMERQHLEAELNSLKAQINPHFLFNTLNNLYSLSLDGSPKTPDMILKLSDLMRYIIYDCKDNKVLAKKEIEFITNYLSLEKLRLGESVSVSFEVVGEPNVYVAPLLFINFLENAFKHSRKTAGSFIHVLFDFSKEDCIYFLSENSVYPDSNILETKYSGIGIDNVKKRLKLLYPNNHELIITNDSEIYKVQLNIQCYE